MMIPSADYKIRRTVRAVRAVRYHETGRTVSYHEIMIQKTILNIY